MNVIMIPLSKKTQKLYPLVKQNICAIIDLVKLTIGVISSSDRLNMRKTILIPAVLIGCMIVIWFGTAAASNQLAQEPIFSVTNSASEIILKSLTNKPETCTLPKRFPATVQQWCHLIEASSQKTGLPANLIAAVMLQESGGDPLAYSSSGAVGLMQVMPRDGIASEFMCMNGPCFSARPTIEELQDPAFNVAYGSEMLADLYTRHGSYREALFRYGPINMGYYYADLVLRIWETY
jgi:soluble lytic murein transglycosylase-like protein